MAMGLAIVAPDSENIREILEDEVDGLLFRIGDHRALLEAVKRLASDDALRARLGMAAAAKIVSRDLTWQRNAEKVISLIEESSRKEKQ
jgi:glycosyltransferase involved in cell wall biosynthesis